MSRPGRSTATTSKSTAISESTRARLEESVAEILETHRPTPLTASQEEAVADVLQEARDYYRGKGLITDSEWTTYMEELSLGDGG